MVDKYYCTPTESCASGTERLRRSKGCQSRWREGNLKSQKPTCSLCRKGHVAPRVTAPGGSHSDFLNLRSRLSHPPLGHLEEDKYKVDVSNKCISSGGLQWSFLFPRGLRGYLASLLIPKTAPQTRKLELRIRPKVTQILNVTIAIWIQCVFNSKPNCAVLPNLALP